MRLSSKRPGELERKNQYVVFTWREQVLAWSEFSNSAPELSVVGIRLLADNEVAFLATTSRTGRPRIHPFVPRVVNGRLVAFIMDSSPKIHDLENRQQYSIHTLPGQEDEEFYISGIASRCDQDQDFRDLVATEMGFVTGVDEHHILYEFKIDRALWTVWLDFGKPTHRPQRVKWVC